MLLYLVKRTAGLVGVLLAMSITLFALQEIIPADPARAAVGPNAPRMLVEAKRKDMGLDQPLVTRYWRYMRNITRGDLGESVHTHNPVARDLAHFMPASAELAFTALALGVSLGGALAMAQTAGPRIGQMLRLTLVIATSAPIFLVGLLLSLLFWYRLGWLPGGGRITPDDFMPGPTGFLILDGVLTGQGRLVASAMKHLFLPALTLALPIAVAVGRTLASSLMDVYRQSYIRTARAKGLTELRVLLRHTLRNAAGPALSMLGLQIAVLFNNLIIVERLFSWPGLGLYTVQAFAAADLPAVLGVALVAAVTYLATGAIIDVVRAALDPRLSLRGQDADALLAPALSVVARWREPGRLDRDRSVK
jgi:ABC-type dipeptide/oligopeptide/nickel transport system permease component